MKTSTYSIIIVVIFLISTGCEEGQHNIKVYGSGPIESKTLELSSFDKIEHTGVANYNITIGSPQSVELKAQQNIIDVMTWEVENHSLKVGLEKNVSVETQEEIRFNITVPAINYIELTGVGDIVLSGDNQHELTVIITGAGNIKAYEMKVDTCNITFTGVGDCHVFVNNELNVNLSGVGNVYYRGDPTIHSTITGVGHLIDANQ
jgi:hypothetical protein